MGNEVVITSTDFKGLDVLLPMIMVLASHVTCVAIHISKYSSCWNIFHRFDSLNYILEVSNSLRAGN